MAGGGGAQGSANPFLSFLPLLLILLIMYFLIMRPQAKKQKERERMLASLKKGDKVVTIGGIHGKIMGFKNNDQVLVLKIDDNVKIEVDRTAIASVLKSESK
ncbi:MAG: preprotein translocase subunit YajC [Calditrichaeota bacterium]|nr:preprotein translocase subunit YajC [Calditrichota bacterium]